MSKDKKINLNLLICGIIFLIVGILYIFLGFYFKEVFYGVADVLGIVMVVEGVLLEVTSFGLLVKHILPNKKGAFWIGFFLGILGIIIAIIMRKDNKKDINKYEDISRLQKLKEQGVLTEDEFELEKSKLLNNKSSKGKEINKNKFIVILVILIILLIVPLAIILSKGFNRKLIAKNTENIIYKIDASELESKLIEELEKSSFNIDDNEFTTTFEVCKDGIEGKTGELNVLYDLKNMKSNKEIENPYKGYILACIYSKQDASSSHTVYIPMFKIDSDTNGKVKNIYYLSAGNKYSGTLGTVNNILIEKYGMKSSYSLDMDSYNREYYYYFPFSGGGKQLHNKKMNIYYSDKNFGVKVMSKLCQDDTFASKLLNEEITMTSWQY